MKGATNMKSKSALIIVCIGLLFFGSPAVHVCQIMFGGKPLTFGGAASAAEKVPSLTWDNLRRLDFRSGKAPADLKKHDGAVVRVPGFIIPLEDNDQQVSEFLLVPYPLACIHVPAPPPNQIVHVKMDNGKKVPFDFYAPVWAEGRLKIQHEQNMYTDTSYFMNGLSIEPYRER
jgi:uncharacterized protein